MGAALIAFSISLVATGLVGWFARRHGLLDQPEDRSSHKTAVPSGGGIGIVLSWLLVTVFMSQGQGSDVWQFALLPGAVVLSVIGWIDDHRPLPARLRFSVQLAVSLYVLVFAWNTGVTSSLVWTGLAALWLLSVSNFYNFMDGSHGMAGMQGVFSGLLLAWLFQQGGAGGMALVSLVVAASCAGFLPWNLRRKRIFMGDAGSVPLGFVLAALCIYGVALGNFAAPAAVLVMVVFLVDAGLTLLGRMLKGERWYTAHRQHLYQQLIARGYSHEVVLALYTAINVCMVLPAAVVTVRNPGIAWLVTLGLIVTMVVGWILAIRRLGVKA